MGEEFRGEMAFAKHQNNVPQHSPIAPSPSSKDSALVNGSKLRRFELILRAITLLSAVAGFVFVITDKQIKSFTIYTSVVVQEALYSDMEILVYSVIALGIVAFYTLSQIVRCVVKSSSTITPSSASAWIIFILDQIMTYFILSAAAGAAQSAYFSEQGNSSFKWMKVCNLYEKFCNQVGTGIVSSYIVFVGLAATSAISACNLFAQPEIEG